jgi:predicted RNA binding protein YcfA (HicA-like mRNA interferase family)
LTKPPRISGDELIKILQRFGFEMRRQRGSHVVLRHFNKVCVVPLHKELKAGTLKGVCEQAGISQQQLTDALKKR